jgi:hypothetical protein
MIAVTGIEALVIESAPDCLNKVNPELESVA